MKQLTLAGHPVHPQVIGFPVGLIPFSSVMDVMYLASGKESHADAAYYSLVGGYVGGLVSAVTGAADYLTISPGGPMKRMANTHAILNIGMMAVETLNIAVRGRKRGGLLPTLLGLIGTAGIVISQWYGGELVYKYGMRVEPATEKKQKQLTPRGEKAMLKGLHRIEKLMPSGGPGSE